MNLQQKVIDGYIADLICRMNTKEEFTHSASTVSWKAHREAEELTDIAFCPILQAYIESHSGVKEKNLRGAAYFILGKLLQKSPQEEYVTFYLSRLAVETDKYILSAMLEKIKDFTISPDAPVQNIIALANDPRWLVSYAAIQALAIVPTAESRQVLAEHLRQPDDKKNKQKILYAAYTLSLIGTSEDIPVLELHKDSKNRDIRSSVTAAIERIQKRQETRFEPPAENRKAAPKRKSLFSRLFKRRTCGEYEVLTRLYPFEDGFDLQYLNAKQAKENFQWYLSVLDSRVSYVAGFCSNALQLDETVLDLSPQSLLPLWRWFLSVAEIEYPDANGEYHIVDALPYDIDTFDITCPVRFSARTEGILQDIGMYLGATITENNPSVIWHYYTKPKRDMFVNHPLLKFENGPIFFEPIHMAKVQAAQLFTDDAHEEDLLNLYNKWMKYV